eukprot:262284-Pleurochrysis_carterae.AAC.8
MRMQRPKRCQHAQLTMLTYSIYDSCDYIQAQTQTPLASTHRRMCTCWSDQLTCARQTKVKQKCWSVAKSVAMDMGVGHGTASDKDSNALFRGGWEHVHRRRHQPFE